MYHVGDFILRIKNAYQARRKQVTMPYSNINKAIAGVLVKEGFLSKMEISEEAGQKVILATLRYENRRATLHNVILISKPSLRVYMSKEDMAKEKDRTATTILSTSTGIMTSKEAVKKGVGGEVLFKLW